MCSLLHPAGCVSLNEHSCANVPCTSVPSSVALSSPPFALSLNLGIFSAQLWLTNFCGIMASSALQSESESHSVMSGSLPPHGLYSPWNSRGQNTGVGCHALLQGIFPTQGSNPGLLPCRRILYQLTHKGITLIGGGTILSHSFN